MEYSYVNMFSGATAVRPYPGGNNMSVANGAQAMFTKAIFSDYKDKDIRMNEVGNLLII